MQVPLVAAKMRRSWKDKKERGMWRERKRERETTRCCYNSCSLCQLVTMERQRKEERETEREGEREREREREIEREREREKDEKWWLEETTPYPQSTGNGFHTLGLGQLKIHLALPPLSHLSLSLLLPVLHLPISHPLSLLHPPFSLLLSLFFFLPVIVSSHHPHRHIILLQLCSLLSYSNPFHHNWLDYYVPWWYTAISIKSTMVKWQKKTREPDKKIKIHFFSVDERKCEFSTLNMSRLERGWLSKAHPPRLSGNSGTQKQSLHHLVKWPFTGPSVSSTTPADSLNGPSRNKRESERERENERIIEGKWGMRVR